MAKLQMRSTHICVWLFLIFVVIVPLFIGVGLALRLDSDDFQDRIITAVSTQLQIPIQEGIDRQPVKILMRKIQVPLLSILLCIFVGSIFALTLFYRYLIRPMDQMAVTARLIIEGNLDISMPENSCYEVNELGRSFNDLSINLQEIILLVWNYLRDSSRVLDEMIGGGPIQEQGKIPQPMRQNLTAIREAMKTIEQVITSFNLYDVRIIDQRAMAGSNTWQGGSEQPVEKIAQKDESNEPV